MTITNVGPPALFQGLRPAVQQTSHTLVPSGSTGLVPRPKVRWATRLLVPTALLFATGALLAYAARDALQPRLEVYIAAAIPKDGVDTTAHTDESAVVSSTLENRADAPLGPVVVQAPGWIEPAPYAVSVPALAEGVVKEVLVLEGDQVEANQIVARLLEDEVRLAHRAAEATVAERASAVALARAELATAESQVEVERAAAAELRDEVMRKRELVAAGGLSEGAFRRMEIRLSGLEAKVRTAERLVGEARAGLVQAESSLVAANVERDEVELRLGRMEVRSPVAGVVLARLVEPGTRMSMSSKSGETGPASSMMGAVVRVYDPAKLQVRVDVPLAEAAKVGVGMQAVVSTEALPDQTFSGVVSRVIHEANIQRNTVQFKVALDAPSPVLKPEMLARVKLHAPALASQGGHGSNTIGSASGDSDGSGLILLVPSDAIVSVDGSKGQVWVVETSGGSAVARRRDITTTPAADPGFTAVISGLRLTDRIILDPPAPPAIRDGVRLKVLGERTSRSFEPSPSTP